MNVKKSLTTKYEENETVIKFKNFEKYGVTVLTTKVSFGDIKSMERNNISEKLIPNNKILISGKQVHSNNIEIILNDDKIYFSDVDGFITNNKNVALMCKFADCLPITFVDIQNDVFGIVHSGWKGSYQAIILKAIEKLKTNFGSNLVNIKFLFGVGISACNYEVKNDFLNKFKEKFSKNIIEKAFIFKNDKIYFDNQIFNVEILKEIGVREKDIFINNFCTYENKDLHSFRRDKEKSGRGGTIIYYSKD